MNLSNDEHRLTSPEQLTALYGEVAPVSIKKEISYVHPLYRQFIEASPFALLATSGPDGLDVSPRGDPAGFVVVEDEHTLLLADPRVALLFLIPGVGETLRVNGTADITTDPTLQGRFEMDGKRPKCVLVIHVETVYFQCARALHRSNLWQPVPPDAPRPVPTAGQILAALSQDAALGETYDRDLPERLRTTLY